MDLDEDGASAVALVPERQLSLAIGKEGQNARLAAKLTGWNIDIKGVESETARAPEEAAPEEAVAEEAAQVPAVVEAQIEEAVAAALKSAEAQEEPEKVEVEAKAEAAEPAVEEPAAEAEPVEAAAATPVDQPGAVEEPALTLEGLLEEPKKEEVPVGAVEQSTSLHDVPEGVWATRGPVAAEPGVIRFAEDIDEIRNRGGRRGRGGSRGRGRRARTSRRR